MLPHVIKSIADRETPLVTPVRDPRPANSGTATFYHLKGFELTLLGSLGALSQSFSLKYYEPSPNGVTI